MIYLSPSGVKFSFSGWDKDESPVDCFDDENWLDCLHGCMLGLTIIRDPLRSQIAIADDGIIHELLHLALSVDVCLSTTMSDLRGKVLSIQHDTYAALGDSLDD